MIGKIVQVPGFTCYAAAGRGSNWCGADNAQVNCFQTWLLPEMHSRFEGHTRFQDCLVYLAVILDFFPVTGNSDARTAGCFAQGENVSRGGRITDPSSAIWNCHPFTTCDPDVCASSKRVQTIVGYSYSGKYIG